MARQRTADAAVRDARGRNLARARAAAGLTLQALGERVGVSGEQVRKYQIGRDFLDAGWCWRFSRALSCSFLTLFAASPATGVAEHAEPFQHETGDGERLRELLGTAAERLSGERRAMLRDILLDLLIEEEAEPSVAVARGIL